MTNHATTISHLQAGTISGQRYALNIPNEAMQGPAGFRLSNQTGSSLDFKDFREYQPGDDLRRIDWNAYARSDRLIVKLYRDEVAPHLDLIIDTSRSIDLPNTPKAAASLRLAAILATAASNAGCSLQSWNAGDSITPITNGNHPAPQWTPPDFITNTPPHEAIHTPPHPRLRRHGIRILISDLLWDADPMLFLRPFSDGATAIHIIQLLTNEEQNPSIQGNHRLTDIESAHYNDIFIDTIARSSYQAALASHQRQWSSACRRTGASFSIITAETLMDKVPDLAHLQQAQIILAI
jgi:uncharacterized protein (DUF58 family)